MAQESWAVILDTHILLIIFPSVPGYCAAGGMWIHRWSDQSHFPLAVAMLSEGDRACVDSKKEWMGSVASEWTQVKQQKHNAIHWHLVGTFPLMDNR
jgi:hypothetical protein